MSALNPRIIVLDESNKIYNVVRTALELLGRTPRLIHAVLPGDALAELSLSTVDLLVTTQSAADTDVNQFAFHAKRELASVAIIVVGEQSDSELETDGVTYQYLRRPFAAETFLRALRVALDGPQAVVPVTETQSDAALMPVPVVKVDKLRNGLFELMRESRAMAAVIADRNGKVLSFDGAAGYFDRDMVAAAVAPILSSTAKLTSLVGDAPRLLHYIEGGKNDAFVLNVGLHHCLILIHDGKAPSGTLAVIRRSGWLVVSDMLKIIGENVAFSPTGSASGASATQTTAAIPAAPKAADKVTDRTADVGRDTSRPASRPEAAPTRPTRNPAPREDRNNPPVEMRETIGSGRKPNRIELPTRREIQPAAPREHVDVPAIPNFDPSIFDNLGAIDTSGADDMFDPSRADMNGDSNKISFEDAMLQGIIGDIQD